MKYIYIQFNVYEAYIFQIFKWETETNIKKLTIILYFFSQTDAWDDQRENGVFPGKIWIWTNILCVWFFLHILNKGLKKNVSF